MTEVTSHGKSKSPVRQVRQRRNIRLTPAHEIRSTPVTSPTRLPGIDYRFVVFCFFANPLYVILPVFIFKRNTRPLDSTNHHMTQRPRRFTCLALPDILPPANNESLQAGTDMKHLFTSVTCVKSFQVFRIFSLSDYTTFNRILSYGTTSPIFSVYFTIAIQLRP